ncbi:histidinol dehydrogenase [Actinobacillus pleuropneumoniae]|nr:histidinol dehydrogenase [Actinobacillus pleuropneumoniae]
MQTLIWKNLTEQQRKEALTRPAISSSLNIQQAVDAIRENVLANGDKALFELSEKFDKVKLDSLVVSKTQIQAASDRLSDELKQAIQNAKANIEKFHTAQIPQPVDIETQAGVRCQVVTRPINRVGLYIPGGSAPLFPPC